MVSRHPLQRRDPRGMPIGEPHRLWLWLFLRWAFRESASVAKRELVAVERETFKGSVTGATSLGSASLRTTASAVASVCMEPAV